MSSRVTVAVKLQTPLTATALWKQLSEVLPWLVRFYVERAYASYEEPPKSVAYRPAIQGPFGNRFRSDELGVNGHVDLIGERGVQLTITSATVSRTGLIVCTLSGDGNPLERFALQADPDCLEAILALLNREGVTCSLGEK